MIARWWPSLSWFPIPGLAVCGPPAVSALRSDLLSQRLSWDMPPSQQLNWDMPPREVLPCACMEAFIQHFQAEIFSEEVFMWLRWRVYRTKD